MVLDVPFYSSSFLSVALYSFRFASKYDRYNFFVFQPVSPLLLLVVLSGSGWFLVVLCVWLWFLVCIDGSWWCLVVLVSSRWF